ncbi:fluoride efflux transporter CrcB [Succinispira mobilis]|uniref:fluoride efflux transporter CrcB n=1 Tax=Succinispira mobilis TaxID=78120 RepID=UPI000374475A|nr:fluoride efflux transporter CrcB [Succinispira mobilis]
MVGIFFIAIGGATGAVCRYLTANWMASKFGANFPLGTLVVNIIGCFVIGLFMAITLGKLSINPYWRLFIAVGFLGGLTTFSSFSYETFMLLQGTDFMRAFYNIALNLFGGFAATWLGFALARFIG